jgi:hypothetical protein
MKLLLTTAAALSLAAIALVTSHVDPAALGLRQSTDPTVAPAQPQLILAQRYRYRDRCQEDLGYGRTGSYGCG